MIAAHAQKGKKIVLFGLGGSGIATAQSLIAGGAQIVCFDDNPASVEKAANLDIPTKDLREVDFQEMDALVLAPGVPLTHPKPHWTADLANAAGVPIIGDVELFAQERNAKAPDAPLIAITGTNGKSTTTALIAHVLKSAGRNVQMGGNIGTAILSLEAPSSEYVYVVEVSSYQIDLAPSLNPSVGILLNLAPDHLDRHGTMDNYASIKARLPRSSDLAIVGLDDPHCIKISDELKSGGVEVTNLSMQPIQNGIYANGTQLIEAKNGVIDALTDLGQAPTLTGKHNAQNAGAAWAACRNVGLSDQEIANGFKSFPGLSHRLEQIGKVGNILFVNDSKGTNSDAAAVALSSFDNIYWIAGGLAKEGGIEELRPLFEKVRKAFLIGEAAPQFAATLGEEAAYEISQTIDMAVVNATNAALEDGGDAIVLLSPACASFDQFPNFEIRGERFRECVEALDGFRSQLDLTMDKERGHG